MRTVFSKRVNYINIHTYIKMGNLFVDFITINQLQFQPADGKQTSKKSHPDVV